MIKIFVKLYIIIFINVNISVVTTHYLCGKVENIRKKNTIFSGKYKYTIIINILFVMFKTLQYFIIITIITGLWKFFI